MVFCYSSTIYRKTTFYEHFRILDDEAIPVGQAVELCNFPYTQQQTFVNRIYKLITLLLAGILQSVP